MSKKTLLWIWLLILALFIFFCIKAKVSDIAPKTDIVSKPEVQKVVEKIEPKKIQPVQVPAVKETKPEVLVEDAKVQEVPKVKEEVKVEKKDISFKIDKSGDNLTINGVLNSKNDFSNLSSKYKNLKDGGLTYDQTANNPEVFGLVLHLNEVIDRFKNGYVEYQNGDLIVDGVVSSQSDKDIIESTLNSIKDLRVSSNIVVDEPKTDIEHVGKLSITKQGDVVTISGIFSSEKEIDDLVKLLKSKNLDVKKELCVVDSDLKEDNWKVPFVLVLDDFINFTKGTIQFDKDTFSIIGETEIKGIKEDVADRLSKEEGDIKLVSDVVYHEPKPTKEEIQEKVNSILKLKSVRFITATGTLLKESKVILDEVADILLQNPDIKVEIAGHTDSDGEAKSNLILSQHRADTVKKYLIKKGIKAENLKAIGYGEGKPLVKNNSERNKQINRRVEFIILGD